MSELKKICIIAEQYPSEGDPSFPFVQQLAYSLSNENVDVSVVIPKSITRTILRRKKILPFKSEDISPDGKTVNVYRPAIVTFSNTKISFLNKLSAWMYSRAIKKGVKCAGKPDCCYSYFWHVGLYTARALKDTDIPLFVQASECELTIEPFMLKNEYLNRVNGVVCASGKNQKESLDAGLTSVDKTTIIVNGYRSDEFYKKDRAEARKKYGFDENAFIVGFVGGFIKRKGLPQLCEAINRFDDVNSIFIGRGEIEPYCKNILYKGSLSHNEIVDYIACADVFVLPTEAEGCCNAIIEALACGLPVVSSNKSFNDEILNDECSIRINEQSSDEIYYAILKIKSDKDLQKKMEKAALEKAKELTIEHRANSVKNYLESII